MQAEILTVKELAEYLRMKPITVYRLVQRGEVPVFKVMSEWRFRKPSIDKWIALQEQSILTPKKRRKGANGKNGSHAHA